MRTRRDRLSLPVLLVAAVAALEVGCRVGLIDPQIVVPPTQMVRGAWEIVGRGEGWRTVILPSATAILVATCFSVLIGTCCALALSRSRMIRSACEPYIVVLPAIPVFALYPVFIAVLGQGVVSLVLTGVLLGVVPMLTQVLAGLDSLPAYLDKLARVYEVRGLSRLTRLTLPGMAPALLTGLRLSSAYSAIGVIAAELILSPRGLGHAIHSAYESFDLTRMYGAILLVLALIGSMYVGIAMVQRRVLAPGHVEVRA
ncbi:ABC transporter permease subunit [Nocardioides sp. LMS-CY]|uniref:ABC transporter permease n=1 Tax=Nocardioides sp. (strain LMS-CY) TaxID=2840457 RepID=UPI001C001248|nr:ABC transporter permease subunit [Nocardioides sp. LMS-CY]QWF19980.1 ABC transporter permease subunit [Nocardioides sp. LMS-CY]